MHLLITMVLMGAVNLVISDPDTHTYSPECEPPTPGFTPPNDTSVALYKQLLPVERCCPACEECVSLGGHCKLRWVPELYPQWCDFTSINECRDYSCTCCVKCADDNCSPCVQSGGECRDKCRVDEQEDNNNLCAFSKTENRTEGCKCCKRCEATSECTDALGKCFTNPDDCPAGSFASTGCCGGCFCCKPVLEGVPSTTPGVPDGCSEPGAYCSETDECATGYYSCFGQCQKTLWEAGLQRVELGYCCVPKQAATGGVNAPPVRSAALRTSLKQYIGQDQL